MDFSLLSGNRNSRKIPAIFFILMLTASLSSTALADSQKKPFQAPWWCRGGHLQTIYGGLFKKNPKIFYRRERIELPDGDFLDLDWLDGEKGKPVLFILHGLASSSGSIYVKNIAQAARAKGWSSVVMNARGQSGEPNRLKETHHAGRTQDLGWALKHIMESKKPEAVYMAGYSLGGNLLLKWLGENAGFIPPEIKKTAAISTAYDLAKTAQILDEKWFQREIYTRGMLRHLKPLAAEKEARFPGLLNQKLALEAKTFRVYDREVTAKINGFKDENEYWAKSSSMNYLAEITTPTLLIHAANDPFLPGDFLPYQEMLKSPALKLLLTEDGGHLGFVTGKSPWQLDPWLETTILEFFEAGE